jgi:hypothetical protein
MAYAPPLGSSTPAGLEYLGGATLLAAASTFGNITIAARENLVVLIQARLTANVLLTRFNADAGANYNWQNLLITTVNAVSNTLSNSDSNIQTSLSFTDPLAITMYIGNVAAQRKPVSFESFQVAGTTIGSRYWRQGVWENTAAQITSIEVFTGIGADIAAGSSIQIYGRNN